VKIQVIRSRYVPGRVLVGPKVIGDGYYRIVSQPDHSGRIEAYDPGFRSWSPAPEEITFSDLWGAPPATQWAMDLAGVPATDVESDDIPVEERQPFFQESELPDVERALQP
jgi:hypothetical protein